MDNTSDISLSKTLLVERASSKSNTFKTLRAFSNPSSVFDKFLKNPSKNQNFCDSETQSYCRIAIKITEVKISTHPTNNFILNCSPKINIPIITDVIGSNVPKIAVF